MIDMESCRQHAADCVLKAHGEDSADDRDILLNVALAWLRLARQVQARAEGSSIDEAVATEADVAVLAMESSPPSAATESVS